MRNNYENQTLRFNITFFSHDITLVKKVNKILTKQPLWTRIKDSDINYDLVVKSSTAFVCEYGRDTELIKELREKCYFELDRIKRNSLSNVKRREEGKELIVSDDISIGFSRKTINTLFAIMKNAIQIDGLTLEVLIHSITLYYVNRVIHSYEGGKNKKFKNNFEIIKEKSKNAIIEEETKEISQFKTLAQVEAEKSITIEPEDVEVIDNSEEEIQTNNSLVLLTKRDKKKLKKEINNMAHSFVVGDLLDKEKAELEALREEKELLQDEIRKLRLTYEGYIINLKEAKGVFKKLSEMFINNSVDAEDYANSINIDSKSWNVMIMNRIIAARKMRGMSIDKQEEQLENLLA